MNTTVTTGSLNLHITLLTAAHALGTLGIAAVMVMASAIQSDFSLSHKEFGSLVSAYYASQFVLAIPVGWLIDRVGVRNGLVVSHVVGCCALVLLSFADNWIEAALSLALLGVSYSILNPATSKGVFDWIPIDGRGVAMGFKQTGVPLGGLVAAAVAALVLEYDWRTIVRFASVLIGLGAFATIALPSSSPSGGQSIRRSFSSDARAILSNKRVHALGLANGIYNVGQIGLWTYITLFLREVLHVSGPLASLGFGLVQAGSVVGRVGWGRMSDRYFRGKRHRFAIAIGVIAAMAFSALAAPINIGISIIVIALLGLTIGSYAGLIQTMTVEAVEPRLAASAIGYNMLFVPLGAMIAPILLGAVLDKTGSFSIGWLLLAATALLGAAILYGAKRIALNSLADGSS